MEIANPIYDVVFKYLMEDTRAAKLLISSLTELDVIDLELRPTEYSTEDVYDGKYTVYRIDFAARVRTPTGSRIVIIEIQKAKFATDIMRFRRYLGEQYSNPNNTYTSERANGKEVKIGEPIISIYLLGHRLETPTMHCPVIKVKRSCIDVATGEVFGCQDPFVEGLTHDSVIVQIPELAQKRRNKLEMLLSIFDQKQILSKDKHTLNLCETVYPHEFNFILRRLLKANAESDVRKKMNVEDGILSELESWERQVVKLSEKTAAALIAKAEAQVEKQQAVAETQQAQAETQLAEAEMQQAQVETQQAQVETQQAQADTQQAQADRQQAQADTQQDQADKQRVQLEKLAEHERAEQAIAANKKMKAKLKELGISDDELEL